MSRNRKVELTEEASAQAKGVKFFPTVVAHDGIAVVVNEKNPVTKLTKKQVEKLFTGDVTDWSAVGGKAGAVSVYTRNTSSGTFKDFETLGMKKRDYAASSQKMAGNEQIVAEVGKNENGIGYVGLAYTKAKGIKVVVIEGTELTDENVRNGAYPYCARTYSLHQRRADRESREFRGFCRERGRPEDRRAGGFH